jgi:hypothetical protein
MFLFTFIQGLFIVYVVKEFCKKNGYEFKEVNDLTDALMTHGNNIACNVAYTLIRQYSKIQIVLQKWLKDNNETSKKDMPHEICIDFCKDNKIVKTIVINKDASEHIQLDVDKYDFAILTDDLHKVNDNVSNKKMLKSPSEKTMCVDKSNIKFLSFNVRYKENVYEIKLHNEKENFYTINNKIDKDFLKFQLKNMGVDVCEEFPYKIELIDHNVNIIELDDKHEIIIKKDDYEIVEKDKEKIEDIEEFVEVESENLHNIFAINYIT